MLRTVILIIVTNSAWWYDTIRDLLPLILGLSPTVRILISSFEWCSLNPEDHKDLATFAENVFRYDDEEEDDDELLPETPRYVVEMLGFDPGSILDDDEN